MNHTPEPWEVDGVTVRAPRGHVSIASILNVAWPCGNKPENPSANARRIVACINACAGIETPDLEVGNAKFIEMLKERSALKQQRDKLLAALDIQPKSPVPMTEAELKIFKLGWLECRAAAKAAIAEVKGDK